MDLVPGEAVGVEERGMCEEMQIRTWEAHRAPRLAEVDATNKKEGVSMAGWESDELSAPVFRLLDVERSAEWKNM